MDLTRLRTPLGLGVTYVAALLLITAAALLYQLSWLVVLIVATVAKGSLKLLAERKLLNDGSKLPILKQTNDLAMWTLLVSLAVVGYGLGHWLFGVTLLVLAAELHNVLTKLKQWKTYILWVGALALTLELTLISLLLRHSLGLWIAALAVPVTIGAGYLAASQQRLLSEPPHLRGRVVDAKWKDVAA